MHILIRVLRYAVSILELLLALRLVLTLFDANEESPLMQWVLAATDPLVWPFKGIFLPTPILGWWVEWAVVVAMIVYAIAGAALTRFLSIFAREERFL